MNLPPKLFITICNISEMPPEKISQVWQDISEKVINDFLKWLINKEDLSVDQQKALETILTDVNSNLNTNKSGVVGLVSPVLNDEQKDDAVSEFAELFVTNLENFYTVLKSTMTIEQRQVADSYIKSSYVGTNS